MNTKIPQLIRAILRTILISTLITCVFPSRGKTQAMLPNLVLSLDGTSGSVSIPSSPDLQNSTELTIEFWLNPRIPSGKYLSKSDGLSPTSARSYDIGLLKDGSVTCQFFWQVQSGKSDYDEIVAPLASNQWTHVAAAFSGKLGVFQLFTNGVVAAQRSGFIGRALRQTSLPLVFGWTPPFADSFASGHLDEVRIWSVARTQAEISESMSCRLTGKEANLTAYYDFDDGTASDLTGHGHNGTLAGNASILPISGADVVHQDGCGAPAITVQPQSQTVNVGETAIFSVSASSVIPLDFQWQLNGVNIPGETSDSLSLKNVQVADVGNYTVIVGDPSGSTASQAARLSVLPTTPSSGLCTALPPNCVAWWKGDGNANDIVGGNNGNLANGAYFVPGLVGQAFRLDGNNQYVEVPDAPTLRMSGSLTVECWINPAVQLSQQHGYAAIVDKYDLGDAVTTTRSGWNLHTVGSAGSGTGWLGFEINNGSNSPGAAGITVYTDNANLAPPGVFTHVAGVFDQSADQLLLYVNGVLRGQRSIGAYSVGLNSVPIRFGTFSTGGPSFAGEIDEVSIFSRALSGDEIKSIADSGSAGVCSRAFDTARLRFSPIQGFRLKLTGSSATKVIVQSTSDFLDWTNVITFLNINQEVEFLDQGAVPFARRFYRTVGP